MTRVVTSADEMMDLGREMAEAHARPGLVIRLIGPLGSGKTTFARGFIRALGYLGEVRSPTFPLVQNYDTQPPVVHADLYRLTKPDDAWDLGLEELMDTACLLVEWADRLPAALPKDSPKIEFAIEGSARTVTAEGFQN